jgi:hypothetical protein
MNFLHLFFLFPFIVNSFNINSPQKHVLFFPLQITYNDVMPINLYDSFLSYLSNKDMKVYKSRGDFNEDCRIIDNLNHNESTTLVCHSTGFNNLLKVYNNVETIDNVVLIDPILLKNKEDKFVLTDDFEDYFNDILQSNKFNLAKSLFFKDKNNNKYIDFSKCNKLEYFYSKKSNNWKVLPPIPPVKRLFLDYKLIKNKNKIFTEVENFGHFDLLDSQWADMIHKSVCKGCNCRDDIYKYYDFISEKINDL